MDKPYKRRVLKKNLKQSFLKKKKEIESKFSKRTLKKFQCALTWSQI